MRGYWMVIVAAMLWGTTGTAQALAPVESTPVTVGALRLVLGGLTLLTIAYLRGTLRNDSAPWRIRPLLFAVIGVAAYQLCFFAGVDRTGVAVGTIAGIGSAPIFAGLLGWLVHGERPDSIWLLSTLLAIAGCTLLAVSGAEIGVDPLGVLLSVGAGFAYAQYTVSSKALLLLHPPESVMAVMFCLAALLLMPFLLSANLVWLADPAGLLAVVHLGVIATGLSYVLFAYGLQTIPSATAVTLSLSEPLTAGVLGVVVVGERLTLPSLVGILLIFFGLVLLTRPKGL